MTRFLKEEDYSGLIRNEIKELLLRSENGGTNDAKILNAEQMAVQQIKHYLFGKYDIDLIFAPTIDDEIDVRDKYIIMITIDCALYHLYTSEAPERMPSIRSERYADVIADLKDVRKGNMTLNLPAITDESGIASFGMRINSKYPDEDNRW